MSGIDTSLLLGLYQSPQGGYGTGSTTSGGGLGVSLPKPKYAPTPPWDTKAKVPRANDLVRQVMAGRKFIDEGAAKLDLAGSSNDYKKLFALYQGLNALYGLAQHANEKGVTAGETDRMQATFERGVEELNTYMAGLNLDKIRLTEGKVGTKSSTAVGVAKQPTKYVTSPLHSGSSEDPVTAFQGQVQFNIHIKQLNKTFDVGVDLADMGATPRTMGNVVNFINSKLEAQGVYTRVASERVPGEPRTTTVGGKTITLGPGVDKWALKVKLDVTEQVTFQPVTTDPAVYVAQNVGDPDPDKDVKTDDSLERAQLVKFQTAGTPPTPQPGEANYVAGRVFSKTLGPEIDAVRATATAADGSVYMLADVVDTVGEQTLRGDKDVALLKYDSAGKLIYARTLGAASEASGLAMSVSADGKVAIAGKVTGGLTTGGVGSTPAAQAATTYGEGVDHAVADSFVTVFNADGEEMWSQRQGATDEDEATALAFGADGSVYVGGRTRSAMPGGAGEIGGWDGYLRGYSATGVSRFVTQYGGTGGDSVAGLVVDGSSVVAAGIENGHGVLRRYDIPVSGAPTLASTRDLGDLQGGDIAGIALDGGQIVVAGSTRNAALDGGAVTSALSGGMDAFAARVASDLTSQASDRLAYYGGSGDDRATAVSVSAGQVWIAGSAGTDLPGGLNPVGKKDAFLARLDVNTGATDWSRRFTAQDGRATPTSIAVSQTGASVLDRLGLPSGELGGEDSDLVTAASSVRAGDQFRVRTAEGTRFKTITIEANDTLQTLATKIKRATSFQVKVEIVPDGDVRRLQIKPMNDRSTVEFGGGPDGRNALEGLGLAPGVVRNQIKEGGKNGKMVSGDGHGEVYGLKLTGDMRIDSKPALKAATDQLSDALSSVRTAYRDLLAAATPKSNVPTGAQAGKVPAYLKGQIANYQAALSRLGG